MTDRQLFKYRAEWHKAWRVLRATPGALREGQKERDARMRWHLLVGAVYLRGLDAGKPKSSTVLTNAEFDAFLKRCAATHSAASLQVQLDLDAQPLLRALYAAAPLFDRMGFDPRAERREAYLRGIYRRQQQPAVAAGARELSIEEMPDEDLQRVLVALAHTVQHATGEPHGHPFTEHVSGRAARNAATHHVGARSGNAGPSAPPRTLPRDTAAAGAHNDNDTSADENDWPF
ncbi:MAG: hypothetical protein LBC18_14855 [Opitutaceae bacterium]|jgi:hypothetical protein|nr:hypothetical protein [Opitutaceae bacterium]